MVDYDIQMKKSTKGKWDNLYPFNRTTNVYDKQSEKFLDILLKENSKLISDNKKYQEQETKRLEALLKAQSESTSNDVVSLLSRIAEIDNLLPTINVREFGAVGDGITDDTLAFQNAINSTIGTRQRTIIVPPTQNSHYLVDKLLIPKDCHILTLQGIGYAKIVFTSLTPFKIKSEMFQPTNLVMTIKNTRSEQEGVFFEDTREFKRLDFDLRVKECIVSYASKLVITRGRGVELLNSFFNNISHQIILTDFPRGVDVEFGGADIQQYKTGVRGFIVKNCRFHYCTAILLDNRSDVEKVMQGVQIIGNQIEGGLAYIWGFCRNGEVSSNVHYQAYENRAALFEFTDVDNVNIDINVSGWNMKKDNYTKRIGRIVQVTGVFENLRVTGVITGVSRNVFTLYKGGKNFYGNVIVTDVVGIGGNNARLLETGLGDYIYDGFYMGGVFESSKSDNVPVHKGDAKNIFKNYKVDTLVSGVYSGTVHNLNY